jgi:hypothetical protein
MRPNSQYRVNLESGRGMVTLPHGLRSGKYSNCTNLGSCGTISSRSPSGARTLATTNSKALKVRPQLAILVVSGTWRIFTASARSRCGQIVVEMVRFTTDLNTLDILPTSRTRAPVPCPRTVFRAYIFDQNDDQGSGQNGLYWQPLSALILHGLGMRSSKTIVLNILIITAAAMRPETSAMVNILMIQANRAVASALLYRCGAQEGCWKGRWSIFYDAEIGGISLCAPDGSEASIARQTLRLSRE